MAPDYNITDHLSTARKTEDIINAFEKDGFRVTNEVRYNNMRGFLAESRDAMIYETGKPKRAYYVEGSGYDMGYLMGMLAPQEVSLMANDYVYNFIPSMINPEVDSRKARIIWGQIWKFLTLITQRLDRKYPNDYPAMLRRELQGIADGASQKVKGVNFSKLWNLNTAFDLVLANLYTGYGMSDLERFLKPRVPSFHQGMLISPMFCNGFSVFKGATQTGSDHFFGRDFMLSAAGVLQHTASMIIYNPTDRAGARKPLPLISMSAPGFTGSLTAMNSEGVAMGVNTIPAANCSRSRPGMNSVMLVRYCTQYAASAEEGVNMIKEAQRGVAWLYVLSDGKADRAVVVESGKTESTIDFLGYASPKLRKYLPDDAFIKANSSSPAQDQGLMQRWNDYQYPSGYLKFNEGLFRLFHKKYKQEDFEKDGFIDPHFKDTNCPDTFYFAPLRNTRPDVLVVTNMHHIPEMRLCMMNLTTVKKIRKPKGVKTANNTYDDIQWRYDMLNHVIQRSYGNITLKEAIRIISFLDPGGMYPDYYSKNTTSSDKKVRVIEGTKSVCDLKTKTILSQYGYYEDGWVKLTLPNYIQSVGSNTDLSASKVEFSLNGKTKTTQEPEQSR